ncbi:hypothetical protein EXN66_Car018536 [Channa argus]|uniref:Uncharacterized protein n=1 Tax=Channa argus TaxID=215402 RepID=A0A6G1QKT2_CHAAH|nr:hypothetical protein EXN66_Car018536 [Channa argus]
MFPACFQLLSLHYIAADVRHLCMGQHLLQWNTYVKLMNTKLVCKTKEFAMKSFQDILFTNFS